MPKVTAARYTGGKEIEKATFQKLVGLMEDKAAWTHGSLHSLAIERRCGEIMVVCIQVRVFDGDGHEHFQRFEFPAFRHVEAAARKAWSFIEQLDKEFEAKE